MQKIGRFIAWLILAALPLQGAAAASMRVCDVSSQVTVGSTKKVGAPAGFDGPVLSSVEGLSPNGLGYGPGVEHGADHHAHAEQSDASHHGSTSTLPDASHTCVVCALCGHGAAAPVNCTSALDSPDLAPAPGWASVRLDSPSLPLPDKPPRA